MKPYSHLHWVAVVFRILAIWIASETLITVPGFIASWYSMQGDDIALQGAAVRLALVRLLASFAGAIVLWSASDWLATVVWRTPESALSPVGWTPIDLQVAAFRAIGAYLLVVGVPDLAELAAGYYTLPTGFGLETTYSGRLWARAIGVGFQVAFGILLLFASPWFAQLWATRPEPDA